MREEILRIENVIRIIDGITYLDNIHFTYSKEKFWALSPGQPW